MKELSISNFSVAIAEGEKSIGNISIGKRMELKISSGLIKKLSEEKLGQLCRQAIDSYILLSCGTIDKIKYYFIIEPGKDRDFVIHNINGEKKCIGYIKHNNSKLSFEHTVPQYIRIFCCQELKKQNICFNYNGKRYN